jgi:hypothetical protein
LEFDAITIATSGSAAAPPPALPDFFFLGKSRRSEIEGLRTSAFDKLLGVMAGMATQAINALRCELNTATLALSF